MDNILRRYNNVLSHINEPFVTKDELSRLPSLPLDFKEKDVILNVKELLLARGVVSSELKRLNQYAVNLGIDLSDKRTHIPKSEVLFGFSVND